MILIFSILNENKNELFQKFFVEKSYFSDIQIKTMANSTPRLLNIVNLTAISQKSEYSSRKFTITNLWFHIVKYKDFYYLFITPTIFSANNKPLDLEKEYKELIKQIDYLINQCTSQKPYFDLIQNNFFVQNVQGLLTNFNKFVLKIFNDIKRQIKEEKPVSVRSFYKESKGKYLVVGTASAGKSSIIAQFFSNWDQEQLKNIRPTINREMNSFKDSLINQNFNLVDLGGQVQYVEMHLKDPNLFKDVNNLIFVIDVRDTKKIDFTKQYLLDIVDRMKMHYDRPFIGIFLHKFDPDEQYELSENVQNWITWIEENLSKLKVDYSYYLTSIKDESAREAFARTLLLTLPYWFLALTIKEDLIIRSLNSLTPIIQDLKTITGEEGDDEINKELFNQSVMFGFATTKIILQKWISHLLIGKNDTNINQEDKDKNISLELINETASLEMRFTCPLINNSKYDDLKNYKGVCEITHGIITGLSQFIGLGNVELEETQIRNKSDFCRFKIYI